MPISREELIQLRAAGYSFGEIARKLHVNRGTVAGMNWRINHPDANGGGYIPKPKMRLRAATQLPDRHYHVSWDD